MNKENEDSVLSSLLNVEEKSNNAPSTSSNPDGIVPRNSEDKNITRPMDMFANDSIKLYTEDSGPKWYPVKGKIVTPPIISKNLPDIFKFMPIYGAPETRSQLEEFQNNKVREYVGCDLGDEDFETLAKFCSPSHLKTGSELVMSTSYPIQGPLPDSAVNNLESNDPSNNLCIVKKLKLRFDKDVKNHYTRRLKYRGIRMVPPSQEEEKGPIQYEPGKDLVFRIRVYRPFYWPNKEKNNSRHSIFSHDILMLGSDTLTTLRERIVCANDIGMRVDVSENPNNLPSTSAKEVFPSGFLFINNTFYVDNRPGCVDYSQPIRQWAAARGLGRFPHRDMDVRLDQVLLKLGHPEVYVHQGCCEHPFTFSSIRLASASDGTFPTHSAVSYNQTIYCATCAEFGARWIVTGCSAVPFDPAFFCDTCLPLYLYHDGRKIGDFKAFSYRGNELNLLKPH